MFGHKSSNQTTVGTAVVQNPSMLDNVSTEDFSSSDSDSDSSTNANDVQQQVQEALNKKEMQTMLNSATTSTPVVVSGTFMSSPSATPTAVVATEPDYSVPVLAPVPEPVSDTDSDQEESVASEPEVQEVSEADIPHPLTAEENKEIEANPVISSVSSPLSSTTSVEEADSQSPSAPIAPPSAPLTVEPAPEPVASETPAEEPPVASVSEESPSSTDPVEEPNVVGEPMIVAVEPVETPIEEVSSPDESKEEASPVASASPEIDTDKLAGMKQQALEHLEPLVDHLDQSPEEEFRTTMMRIQANDNHTLLERAFEAAKKINDDKERAQAMLDIVNEINYFSQKN